MLSTTNVLRAFRPHPGRPGTWLLKEDWPLGGVWWLDERTSLGPAEIHLQLDPADTWTAASFAEPSNIAG